MNEKKQCSELFKVPESEYGAEYKEHLLEQYKLFVKTASEVSAQRQTANNYFLTINAFLVSVFGILAESAGIGTDVGTVHQRTWRFLVPVTGILICATWAILIRSFRQLNTSKFKVIHRLEAVLPVALFDAEWVDLESEQKYLLLANVETGIPLLFGVLYLVLFVFGVMGLRL